MDIIQEGVDFERAVKEAEYQQRRAGIFRRTDHANTPRLLDRNTYGLPLEKLGPITQQIVLDANPQKAFWVDFNSRPHSSSAGVITLRFPTVDSGINSLSFAMFGHIDTEEAITESDISLGEYMALIGQVSYRDFNDLWLDASSNTHYLYSSLRSHLIKGGTTDHEAARVACREIIRMDRFKKLALMDELLDMLSKAPVLSLASTR